MTTQQTGTITTWKDDKGFGFITPDHGGQQIFFHISDVLPRQVRPAEQMKVRFTVIYEQQQRPRATSIYFTQPQKNFRVNQPQKNPLALPVVTVGVFFVVLLLWSYAVQLPLWVPAIYVLVSLITFHMYGVDKAHAEEGAQRVPESTLHLLEFLGGWPGALIAQPYHRHKTIKSSFQSSYWAAVVANLVMIIVCSLIYRVW